MQAELLVLSPLVPRREVTFLRFCNQLAEGVWAVVDVSIDGLERDQCLDRNMKCRRLPSGCVVQEIPNGCKVHHSNSLPLLGSLKTSGSFAFSCLTNPCLSSILEVPNFQCRGPVYQYDFGIPQKTINY
jgi:hypothetical protein